MHKCFVHILGLLSLFCLFGQLIEPFFFTEKENASLFVDAEQEADDEQEEKEDSLEDQKKELKSIGQFDAFPHKKSSATCTSKYNKGKVTKPYLALAYPPPESP